MKTGRKVTMEAKGESVNMGAQEVTAGEADEELIRVRINPEVVGVSHEEFILGDGTRLIAGVPGHVRKSVARPHLKGLDGHAPWLILAD